MSTPLRGPRKDRQAYVLLFAVGTLFLVASVSSSMMDSSGAEARLARHRQHLTLARTTAESGIEYGMAIINREVSQADGPWFRSSYVIPGWPSNVNAGNPYAWLAPLTFMTRDGLTNAQDIEVPIRMGDLRFGPDGRTGDPRMMVQFQLALMPSLNFATIRTATVNQAPTIFRLRSRGEILFDDNPADNQPGRILGEAVMIQSFMVRGFHPQCLEPRVVRLHMDFEPVQFFNDITTGGIPMNPH